MGHDITLQTTNGKKHLYWIRYGCDKYPDLYKIMGVAAVSNKYNFELREMNKKIGVEPV
jgi:hypothetical protein